MWRKFVTGYYEPPTKVNGHTYYRAHTIWSLTLLDKHEKTTFGEGITVGERINSRTNAIDYVDLPSHLEQHKTYPGGWVPDHYALTFSSDRGQVTTSQTYIVGGREADFTATTDAKGMVVEDSNTNYWAPFH